MIMNDEQGIPLPVGLGFEAAEMLAKLLPIRSRVLDVGTGKGGAASYFRRFGFEVVTLDIADNVEADIHGDFVLVGDGRLGEFDAVWSSHVMEHQRNVGLFLDQCARVLRVGGWLAITVPPSKDEVVSGHLTIWNAGLLLYNMVCAGFDCSQAKVKTYGYNVSVIVQRPTQLQYEEILDKVNSYNWGIPNMLQYFPYGFHNKIDGRIKEQNWRAST